MPDNASAPAPWLLKGVSLPSGQRTDLGIAAGYLVEPATLRRPTVIDADGLIALPGLVDLHTHLRQPAPDPAETIASGTSAAAAGGYTAVFAMANTDPVTDTAQRVRALRALATQARAEVVPVGALTRGLAGREVVDLAAMADAGVSLFSDDGHCVMDAAILRQAMVRAAARGAVVAEHCQDHHLAGPGAWRPANPAGQDCDPTAWPGVAESAMVARDVQLARDTGAHLHLCHLSTAESVAILAWAKARHIAVSAEVTPHHLLLDAALLDRGDPGYKVNPPLRSDEDRQALRAGLASGLIDIVATDHAPHHPRDKQLPISQAKPGLIGLEQALAVVIVTMVRPGLLDWAGVAQRMSITPARIGQVADRQGRAIAVGQPANLTLVDPTAQARVDQDRSASQGRNNPYHGLSLPDPVRATFWRGRPTFLHPSLTRA